MKKKINYKKKYIKKELLLFIVFFLFSFYIVSGLILLDRNYFLFESFFKENASKLSVVFKKKIYTNNRLSDDVINSKISFLKEENKVLRELSDLKKDNVNYEIAEVSKMAYTDFFSMLEISKGKESGIKKDNPVINSEGLIGFISKTANNVSEVKLITSISEQNMLSVFINTSEGNISGLLNSYNKKKGLFKIINVSSKSNVKNGDIVYLSGYNNELYKGIYLGKVEMVEESNYGLKKNVYVKSNVNFDDILYVIVVKE